MKSILPLFLLLIATALYGQNMPSQPYSIGEKHTIFSDILQEEREIFIHIPPGFWGMDTDSSNYAVAYVLDGESQFFQTTAAIDLMSSAPMGNDLMPRTIVVGIPNTNRNRDLTPTSGMIGTDSTTIAQTGGGLKFLDFITTEVSPYLDSLYAIQNHSTIIGHSLGGLIVFEALLNRRTHFNNYLAIDPAMSYDNEKYFERVLDTLRQADLSDKRLFIAKANTFLTFLNTEDITQDTSEITRLTRVNEKFGRLAQSENWNINYSFQDFPNENHFSVPYHATYASMKFMYDFFPFPEIMDYYHPAFQEKSDLVDRLKAHHKMISEKLGYQHIPMQSYLNSWAYGIAHFGRKDLAIDLFDYSIELYDNAAAYSSKGLFLWNKGEKIEGRVLLEKSLEMKEDVYVRGILEE